MIQSVNYFKFGTHSHTYTHKEQTKRLAKNTRIHEQTRVDGLERCSNEFWW